MNTAWVEGYGLYGKSHAVEVLLDPNGRPMTTTRARRPACLGKRVKATTKPFVEDVQSCQLCIVEVRRRPLSKIRMED